MQAASTFPGFYSACRGQEPEKADLSHSVPVEAPYATTGCTAKARKTLLAWLVLAWRPLFLLQGGAALQV